MKLLSRFVRSYVIFSALLLTLSTPLFYTVVNYLFLEEIEEELHMHVSDFVNATPLIKSSTDIEQYSNFNKEISIHAVDELPAKDSLFTIELYDSLEDEMVPYRVLRSGLVFDGRPYKIEIKESLFENEDIIEAIVGAQIVLFALLLIGLVVINRNLSKKIWGPFYHMLAELKDYDIRSGIAFSSEHPNITEFVDLKKELSALIERSVQAYQNQKEFTENAAHEMQTPVAICLSKIEVLMQSHDLSASQALVIEELNESAQRLSRLNKNLLLLSRIDNQSFLETERISISKLVEHHVGHFQDQFELRQLSVSIEGINDFTITANPTLIEILLTNLLSNAAKYTPVGGKVVIRINSGSLEVANSGDPLKNAKVIFQRFQRGKNQAPGNGLGLAIAKSICDRSGFSISYSYEDGMHRLNVKFS